MESERRQARVPLDIRQPNKQRHHAYGKIRARGTLANAEVVKWLQDMPGVRDVKWLQKQKLQDQLAAVGCGVMAEAWL